MLGLVEPASGERRSATPVSRSGKRRARSGLRKAQQVLKLDAASFDGIGGAPVDLGSTPNLAEAESGIQRSPCGARHDWNHETFQGIEVNATPPLRQTRTVKNADD
jgi:hypothetical protein